MSWPKKSVLKCPVGFGGASVSGEGGGYGFGFISEADSIELIQKAYHAAAKTAVSLIGHMR